MVFFNSLSSQSWLQKSHLICFCLSSVTVMIAKESLNDFWNWKAKYLADWDHLWLNSEEFQCMECVTLNVISRSAWFLFWLYNYKYNTKYFSRQVIPIGDYEYYLGVSFEIITVCTHACIHMIQLHTQIYYYSHYYYTR